MKSLFSFKGRVGRLKFLQTFLAGLMLLIACNYLLAWTWTSMMPTDDSKPLTSTGLLSVKFILLALEVAIVWAIVWALSANWTKRLHDVGATGWYQLILLVPYINLGMLFLFFAKGTPGPNKYDEK